MTKTTKPDLTFGRMKRQYATEESCKRLLTDLRWPGGKITCPRCMSGKVYKTSQAFRWKCKACNKGGYRFSVLTGTVFENTNVPLKTWFEVAFLMVSSKKGISALQVHRMIDPVRGAKGSYKTAWYMCHRLRAAMQGGVLKLDGVVEIDETYVGGKEKNKHKNKRGDVRGGTGGKVGVIGAIARKGNVVAQVMERGLDLATVESFVRETISDKVTLVASDDNKQYAFMHYGPNARHESVNHSRGEYVRGDVHTANLDSFWSLLKRGIVGTYHKVSTEYLPLYLNEFSWRHNNRNNEEIFRAVLAGC